MKYFTAALVLFVLYFLFFGKTSDKINPEGKIESTSEFSSEKSKSSEPPEKENPAYVYISPELNSELWQHYENSPKNKQLDNPADPWIPLGPYGEWNRTQQGSARFSGKILDVELTNQGYIRIGSANGGLWEQPFIGDAQPISNDITSQKIGAFASHPINPDVIYVGTGELWTDNSRAGTGIFRTTNKGVNWTNIYPLSSFGSLFSVSKIIIDPSNTQNIHIVGRGNPNNYLRSTNNGANWFSQLIGNSVTVSDLVLNPQSPNILIASTWNSSNGTCIYKTTDYGVTWNPVTAGLPTSNIANTMLAMCKFQPNNLYAIISNNASNLEGIYKSTNTGDNWTKLNTIPPAFDILGGQGFHAIGITVSPVNPNIVLAGGVSLIRSTNGGASWDSVTSPRRSNAYVHADIQNFKWRDDGGQLYMCNDGGLAISSDNGVNWNTDINKFPISEITYFDMSENNQAYMAAGLEHNGMCVTNNGGVTWNMTFGGDGSGAAVDPNNPNNMYGTLGVFDDPVNNLPFQPLYSSNAGTSWNNVTSNITNGCGQWYNQIHSNKNANDFQLYLNICKKMYRSFNNGTTWQDLNMPSTATSFIDNGFDVLPLSSSIVVATNDSTTSNTNKAFMSLSTLWFDISPNIGNKILQKIKAAYVITAVTRGATDSNNKVLKMDFNSFTAPNWIKVRGNGLGKYPLTDVQIDYDDTSRIIVGTQGFGCFATTNGGQNWYSWNEGLPKGLTIAEMKFFTDASNQSYVYIGTYGRGIFKRKLNAEVISVSNSSEIVKNYFLRQNYPNPFNPSTKIDYKLAAAGNVELKIYDALGKEVKTLINERQTAGTHSAAFNGANLPSGIYFYKLVTDNFSDVKKMILVK